MALKDVWIDKVNDEDYVDADDINKIAQAVIDLEESGGNVSEEAVENIVIQYLEKNPPAPGKDGYTPVRGVDYWTEEDQTEMVNAVIDALPKYNGEVETV